MKDQLQRRLLIAIRVGSMAFIIVRLLPSGSKEPVLLIDHTPLAPETIVAVATNALGTNVFTWRPAVESAALGDAAGMWMRVLAPNDPNLRFAAPTHWKVSHSPAHIQFYTEGFNNYRCDRRKGFFDHQFPPISLKTDGLAFVGFWLVCGKGTNAILRSRVHLVFTGKDEPVLLAGREAKAWLKEGVADYDEETLYSGRWEDTAPAGGRTVTNAVTRRSDRANLGTNR